MRMNLNLQKLISWIAIWILGFYVPFNIYSRARQFWLEYGIIDFVFLGVCAIVAIILTFKFQDTPMKLLLFSSVAFCVLSYISLLTGTYNVFPNSVMNNATILGIDFQPMGILYSLFIFCAICFNGSAFKIFGQNLDSGDKQIRNIELLGLFIASLVYLSFTYVFDAYNIVFPGSSIISSLFLLFVVIHKDDIASNYQKEIAPEINDKNDNLREEKEENEKIDINNENKQTDLALIGNSVVVVIFWLFTTAIIYGTFFILMQTVDDLREIIDFTYITVNLGIGALIVSFIIQIEALFNNPKLKWIRITLFSIIITFGTSIMYYSAVSGEIRYILWFVAGIVVVCSLVLYLKVLKRSNLLGLGGVLFSVGIILGGYIDFIPFHFEQMIQLQSWIYYSAIGIGILIMTIMLVQELSIIKLKHKPL